MWRRYNAASVYFDWALLEGQPGTYTASGVFDLALFLQVAKEAGMFIIAVSSNSNVF
jgi:beta-galactosidase GanA